MPATKSTSLNRGSRRMSGRWIWPPGNTAGSWPRLYLWVCSLYTLFSPLSALCAEYFRLAVTWHRPFRSCLKNDKTPSRGIFFTRISLIFLEIRQDSCGKLPCLTKKSVSIRHSANFQTSSLIWTRPQINLETDCWKSRRFGSVGIFPCFINIFTLQKILARWYNFILL